MVIRLDENYNAMTSTALLGYVGETNARPVSVEGLTVDGADRYVMTIDYGDGTAYEVDITGGQWTPTADILRSAQTVSCQICAKKLSGNEYVLVKKSRIFRLRIGAAIGDNAVPSPSVAADALDRIDAIGTQVAADRKAAETAAQTAQAVADSLPDDYVTAVGKIAENTAEIANVKQTDKELQRRVNALFDIGQGITHRFETDSEAAYAKTVPTGAKLMSVKSIGGHSEVIDGKIVSTGTEEIVEQGKNLWNIDGYTASDLVDLGRGYCGIKLGVSPNSAYCISVARDTALCETYGKVIGADKRDIEFFGHKTVSSINAYTGHPIKIQTADENYVYVVINSFNGFDKWKSDFLKYFPNFQIEKSSTATAYAPFHRNTYQIPEAIRNLPGYGIEGNVTDYEAKTYTQNNTVDGTEIKALDTPIVTDISALIPDDFLRNVEVEAGGSVIFKNSNDSYLIPVPSEEEYIVKLSEIGGTT